MTATEVAPAPIEVVTPIKPSEAIRLGCLIAPVQSFGSYIDLDGAACAIGAASLAYGEDPGVTHFKPSFWPQAGIPCPEPDCTGTAGIMHLNDAHRWSRERIADWLEGIGL
jgi:hypothetical protein